jgi:hypothetical protein
MATARTARDFLWQIGGFANDGALDKVLISLRAAGLLRPSLRGRRANHLTPAELAAVTLALRGENDPDETRCLMALVPDAQDAGYGTLGERLAMAINEGAEDILAGREPRMVRERWTLTLIRRGPQIWAHITRATNGGRAVECFSQQLTAAPEPGRGLAKVIVIDSEIFQVVSTLNADTVLKELVHRGGPSPDENAVPKNEAQAGVPAPRSASCLDSLNFLAFPSAGALNDHPKMSAPAGLPGPAGASHSEGRLHPHRRHGTQTGSRNASIAIAGSSNNQQSKHFVGMRSAGLPPPEERPREDAYELQTAVL